MFNLKKNLFLEGKMQSLCSGKYLRTLVFLGLSAAPFQWVSAQFNLSLTNPNIKYIDNQLVTVIKIQMICKCKYKTI